MNWKTDIKNWNKISDKTASLLINQCETALKETNDTAKGISVRADKIISILLPIASGIIIYILNTPITKANIFLVLTGFFSLIVIVFSLWLSYKSYKRYEVAIPGQFPEKILRSKFIDNDFDEKQQYLNLVVNICEDIQDRIDFNISKSNIRMANNTTSVYVLFLLPICPIVGYLISFLLRSHCF